MHTYTPTFRQRQGTVEAKIWTRKNQVVCYLCTGWYWRDQWLTKLRSNVCARNLEASLGFASFTLSASFCFGDSFGDTFSIRYTQKHSQLKNQLKRHVHQAWIAPPFSSKMYLKSWKVMLGPPSSRCPAKTCEVPMSGNRETTGKHMELIWKNTSFIQVLSQPNLKEQRTNGSNIIRSRMVEIIDSIIIVDRLNSGLTNHRLRGLDPGAIIFLILSQSNEDKSVSFFTWKGISFQDQTDVQVHVQVSHVTYKAKRAHWYHKLCPAAVSKMGESLMTSKIVPVQKHKQHMKVVDHSEGMAHLGCSCSRSHCAVLAARDLTLLTGGKLMIQPWCVPYLHGGVTCNMSREYIDIWSSIMYLHNLYMCQKMTGFNKHRKIDVKLNFSKMSNFFCTTIPSMTATGCRQATKGSTLAVALLYSNHGSFPSFTTRSVTPKPAPKVYKRLRTPVIHNQWLCFTHSRW